MSKATPPLPPAAGFDAARLISSHQAGVWRYLRVLGCDASLAEDLTQETFLTVLQLQKPLEDYNPSATAAYLRKVAYHRLMTHQRRAGRVVFTDDVQQLEGQWAHWAGEDQGETLLQVLRDCLQQLTERARGALNMRFGQRLTRIEIAAALSLTEHGAKNLMQRAKKQLRVCIEGKLA
jgi:RNA polymerase sigma-70 factor (ECF subfamily)